MKKFSLKKSVIALFIFAVLITAGISVFILSAGAEDPLEYEGYFYTVTDGEATILYADNTVKGDVVIPSELGGYPVVSIGGLSDHGEITSVTIPSTVKTIRERAFYNCAKMESVDIPYSVTTIGAYAFEHCHSLKSVYIPSSVTSIQITSFEGCINLSSIEVSASNQKYCSVGGVLLNKDKTQLISAPTGYSGNYTIPSTVTSIGEYAFNSCNRLTGVQIPISVKSIGDNAFRGCSMLAEVELPNTLQSVGYYAFGNCGKIEYIYIPASLTSIGQAAFATSGELRSIDVAAGNPNYCSVDGVLYNKEKTVLMQMPSRFATGSFCIPNTVTKIDESAFDGNIIKLEIPDSVKTIADYAFDEIALLTDVYYTGSEEQWNMIEVSLDYKNFFLDQATVHFNSKMPECLHETWIDVVDEKCLISEATCMAQSIYYKTCRLCGKISETETFGHGEFALDNHDFRKDLIQGPDTHYYDCNRCHARKDEAPHDYSYTSYGGTHLGICSCGKATGLEDCSGGTATCTKRAICENCEGTYGNLDFSNHDYDTATWGYQGEDGHAHICKSVGCNAHATVNPHTSGGPATETTDEVCTVCGYIIAPALGHTEHTPSGAWHYDELEHWQVCSVCGDEQASSREVHSGGTANCSERAVCEDCGVSYGGLGAHDYREDMILGPDTHYYDCNICHARKDEELHEYLDFISYGGTHLGTCSCGHSALMNCYGGTATCVDKAICEACGGAYGSTDADNHDFSGGLVQGNTLHYYECSYCGVSKDAEYHEYPDEYTPCGDGTHVRYCVSCGKEERINCSGGTATCTERAACEVCGAEYGDVDADDHDYSSELIQGASTHYYECARCHGRKSEETHEYICHISNDDGTHTDICTCEKTVNVSCSGDDATATCQKRAACEYCGGEYGSLGDHEYDLLRWGYISVGGHAHTCVNSGCSAHDATEAHVSSGAATEETAEICTACGYIIAPATGHISHTPAERWYADESNHWKVCTGCNDQKFEQGEHVYYNACDMTCNTCGYKRLTTHSYEEKTDETRHWDECIFCGEERDNSSSVHFGGKANCTERAVCVYCSRPYGETDPRNHSKDTYYNVTNGDGTHKRLHACCGAVEAESEGCRGGNADCQTGAICENCRGEYGSLGDHDYDLTAWGYMGAEGHAHMCRISGCTEHSGVIPHTSSGAATETEASTCTECGYVIEPATGHIKHTPANEWSYNEAEHRKKCTGCDEMEFEKGTHEYDNSCDTSCNICGYARQITHKYIYKGNEAQHWQECSVCGAEKENSRDAHVAGIIATCTRPAKCAACGVEFGEVVPHVYDTKWYYDGDGHWRECSCGSRQYGSGHSYDENGRCVCGAEKSYQITTVTENIGNTNAPNDTESTDSKGNGTDNGCGSSIMATPLTLMMIAMSVCVMVLTKKRIG